MSLDPKKEFADISAAYQSQTKQDKVNILLLGESGTGKTYTIGTTAPRPVHIDSFDVGGTKGLRKLIEKGEVIADTRFELEDPFNPTVYNLWKSEFDRRRVGGYFNHIGTYVIDSSTTWGEAIMNSVLLKAKIPGQAPRFTHDYVPQKIEMQNRLQECMNLPCHFILLGHHEIMQDVDDKGSTVMRFKFLTTGKAMITIPLKFDEIYTMISRETSSGIKRVILTAYDGVHQARSRMSADGKLSTFEEPNIRELLKKAGMSWEDKPLLNG